MSTSLQSTPLSAPGGASAARPGVMPLSIREKSALLAAYMPFLENGGLFVPTQKPAQLGDELYIVLTLMDDPAKTALPGKVVWITPPGTTGRPQGVGVHFNKTAASEQVRDKIEKLLGPALKSTNSSYTI
ncbi:MAG: PilZ domain-containing protein [Lautropia sp.]|nr:PilZ domain-containing protein [Lautropia sp.]